MSEIFGVKQSAENTKSIEDATTEECMLGSGGEFWVKVLRSGSVQHLSLFGRVAPANISGNLGDRGIHGLQSISRYRFDIGKEESPGAA
jgi:hypothetical protein